MSTGLGSFHAGRNYSFLTSPNFANDQLVVNFGHTISSNDFREWMRFCFVGIGSLTAGTTYTFKIPLMNPNNNQKISFRYVLEEVNSL